MRTKGQAALEFLSTYAWAFLVIMIMIAALAYFGVLRPNDILPDRCTMGAGIQCEEYLLDGDFSNDGATTLDEQVVIIRLKNSLGEPIVILPNTNETFSLTVEGDPGAASLATTFRAECSNLTVDGSEWPLAGLNWATGESHDFQWNACDDDHGTVIGEKTKLFLDISYYPARTGPEFTKTISGEMFNKVQS